MTPFSAADVADDDLIVAGYGIADDGGPTVEADLVLPSAKDPTKVARAIIDARYREDGHLLLRHWRGAFLRWESTHWAELEADGLRSDVYKTLESAVWLDAKGEEQPWEPSRRKVTDVLDAVKAITFLRETVEPPSWLKAVGAPPARELIAARNGLLHVPTRRLLPHNPALFNRVAVPFDFDQAAPKPARWLSFLGEVWPDEPDAISALQEFAGYILGGSTNLQKALLVVGPTRGGKGVIARVLTALVGRQNVAAPTLASLAQNFGLAPLVGKSLAVVSDARLGSAAGTNVVVERLLSISGEDTLTIDRKFRETWTGQLGTRLFIISNELPRFGDSSRAIARRFLVLTTRHSWLGRENPRLTDQLLTELPGILNWALDGLERLGRAGRFTQPASSQEAITLLEDLASPTSAFVRERCHVDPHAEVLVEELFDAWKRWCEGQGIDRPGTIQAFGRDLRAVAPSVQVARQQEAGSRRRFYAGIALIRAGEVPQ